MNATIFPVGPSTTSSCGMTEKVNQDASNLRILKAAHVRIQVPYYNGVPPQESVYCLLKTWKVIKSV